LFFVPTNGYGYTNSKNSSSDAYSCVAAVAAAPSAASFYSKAAMI
jgi:hypothetical protein